MTVFRLRNREVDVKENNKSIIMEYKHELKELREDIYKSTLKEKIWLLQLYIKMLCHILLSKLLQQPFHKWKLRKRLDSEKDLVLLNI